MTEDLPQRRTSRTCCHISKVRNLVVNLDGTGNQFGKNSTNVVELVSRLKRSESQLIYYDSGLGTYARPSYFSWSSIKQAFDHGIDSAIAWNFERIVHAAYKWLSENYQPGDQIFIFGFSRGAYEARVIAGMIEKVGLILKGNERQIPFAYELYTSVTSNEPRSAAVWARFKDKMLGSLDPARESRTHQVPNPPKPQSNTTRTLVSNVSRKEVSICEQFKNSLCHKNVRVHFVGAWDTVSSIGIFRARSLPETVSGMEHVCHFRHALALDERRAKFQPEYANGGLGPKDAGGLGDVKEVWFAGSHSDIGGGNDPDPKSKIFSASLRWMTHEAIACGLEIEPFEGTWGPVKFTESLTWRWRVLEYLPFRSLTYTGKDTITYRPHRGRARQIQPGQRIHQSVFIEGPRYKTKYNRVGGRLAPWNIFRSANKGGTFMGPSNRPYTPKAILYSGFEFMDWDFLFFLGVPEELPNMVEKDPYSSLSSALQELSRAVMNSKRDGVELLGTIFNDCAHFGYLEEIPDAGRTLLHILRRFSHLPPDASTGEWEQLIKLLTHARSIPHIERYVKTSTLRDFSHELSLPSITRSDWQRVFRSFGDGCIEAWRIEDFVAGKSSVSSATFSTKDPNNRVLVISDDSGVSILVRHGSKYLPRVTTLGRFTGQRPAISTDGSYVIAIGGSDINIIQAPLPLPTVSEENGLPVPVSPAHRDENGLLLPTRTTRISLEYNDVVTRCCFSHDNRIIASAHYDGTIKLWKRKKDTWEVFKRVPFGSYQLHSYFLAFTPDASRLAFEDDTIKVWTIDSDEVLELEASQRSTCVSWCSSGRYIASGGMDGNVRLWNCDQAEVFTSFVAHDAHILSITFRPDGNLLATGDDAGNIRVWEWVKWEKLWDFNLDPSSECIVSLDFSPNGKRLLSGGKEGSFRIWDVEVDPHEDVTPAITRHNSVTL